MLAESTLSPDTINYSAADTRLHPLTALAAVRRLLANPEDTNQVFVILRAMRGRSAQRMFWRFAKSPTGAAVFAQKRSLLATLQDSDALRAMPQGSLGRTYQAFMDEEHLTAEGLVESSSVWREDKLPREVVIFRERMRDMHDLTHVMTGYGRDRLGELCLLAFMFAQSGNLGMGMIAAMGVLKNRHEKILGAVLEAWRHGRKAAWLAQQDWEAMLARPLDTLRAEVGIAPPLRYRPFP